MLSVPTIFLLSTFGVISKTIVDVVNLNLEFNRIEKEMNTEKTKIIFNHKILSDYFLNYKNNKNKIDHTISVKLKPTELIVGYDDELKPIIVDFKRTPHAGVMGGSEMGKSKCVETMIDILNVLLHQGTLEIILVQIGSGHDHNVGLQLHHQRDHLFEANVVGLDLGVLLGNGKDHVAWVIGNVVNRNIGACGEL